MARLGFSASAEAVEGLVGPRGFPAELGSNRSKQCLQMAYSAPLEGG
jgi:hypothetical protein